MSEERERALEAYHNRPGSPGSTSNIFRAGYDARAPEVERLRAKLAESDQIARDAIGLKNERAEQAETSIRELSAEIAVIRRDRDKLFDLLQACAGRLQEREDDLATARERVREQTARADAHLNAAETAALHLQQAERERDEMSKVVESATKECDATIATLTDMLVINNRCVVSAEAELDTLRCIRALLAPKETNG